MTTLQDIKAKYGVSQADAEGSDVARKRRQEETIRAAEKNISNVIKAYVELAQKFQKGTRRQQVRERSQDARLDSIGGFYGNA